MIANVCAQMNVVRTRAFNGTVNVNAMNSVLMEGLVTRIVNVFAHTTNVMNTNYPEPQTVLANVKIFARLVLELFPFQFMMVGANAYATNLVLKAIFKMSSIAVAIPMQMD